MELREIHCEGFRAFVGTMLITPGNPEIKPFSLSGDWLYKPDTDCWYCKGRSFPANTCQQIAIFIPYEGLEL